MTHEKTNNFQIKRSLRLKVIGIGGFIAGFLIGSLIKGDISSDSLAAYSLGSALGTGAIVGGLGILGFSLTLGKNKTEKRLRLAGIIGSTVSIILSIIYLI